MKILTEWLRAYLPTLPVTDRQLADDLTLRGIAVEGVHVLPVGEDGAAQGHLFEMDITTNRVDAMNHYGIAREAATIYDLSLPPLGRDLSLPLTGGQAAPPFPVRVERAAEGLCGRFTARVLRGIAVAPSAGHVRDRFDPLGQKCISNAVDASNFTLLGMGHPTHAFDLDCIEGGIVVRLARRGETLRLLDGTVRSLEPDDLVIADERKALSLAGVMGGMDSSITAETRNVLVESAWFDPATVRRSSRRHLLHTDASHRFERGADFNAAPLANDLVSALILQAGGGHAEPALADWVHSPTADRTAGRPPVRLSIREVRRQLGTTIEDRDGRSALTADLVAQYLGSLGCRLHADREDGFLVELPSWRLDLEREIDLIEEVARVFGYNRFANTLPSPMPVVRHPAADAEAAVRSRLLAMGWSEAISSTFAGSDEAAFFARPASDAPLREGDAIHPVPLENPLSEEASLLRPSLLPGMLGMLAGNLYRDVREARLFELGEVFTGSTPADAGTLDAVQETRTLCLGMTTAAPAGTPLVPAADTPIYEFKGVIEALATAFALPGGAESLVFVPGEASPGGAPAWLEPGRSGIARLHGQPFAIFGELARSEQHRRKLRQPVFLATIAVADLLALPLRRRTAQEISRFQAAERDFAFLLPDETEWHTILAAIDALALPDLQRVTPVEIFRDSKGKTVPAGQHSLLLRTVFQSKARTLRDADLGEASGRLIGAVEALGGTLRS